MKFWQFLAALVLLLVCGAIIYRIIYTLRTGRDLTADRANAAANLFAAAKDYAGAQQPAPTLPAAQKGTPTMAGSDILKILG